MFHIKNINSMRIKVTIIWVILSFGVCGQEKGSFDFINASYLDNLVYFRLRVSDSVENQFNGELVQFCENLASRKSKYINEKVFLQKVFYKVQQTYLKRYNQYSTFEDLMQKGDYDCVSGTTLYALILSILGFEITIQETPFHTYLLVFLSNNQKVLIESTSVGQGFITNEKKIVQTIRQFMDLHKQDGSKRNTYSK